MTQGTYAQEPTGVYRGTLLEDMILTVRRIKKPYIDVYVPELHFNDDTPHPLCYVPVWFQSVPLKKGDEVLIQYNQNSLRYPVLYKPVMELDETMVKEKVDLPESEVSAQPTENILNLGNECYLISTAGYSTLIRNGQAVILTDDGVYIKAGGDVKINGDTSVLINGHLKVIP